VRKRIEPGTCQCGCGDPVVNKPGGRQYRYVRGHKPQDDARDLTPAERVLISQMAAYARWKGMGPDERRAGTAPARSTFMDRFDREVDPEGVLPPAERSWRAERAKKAYFARLAYAASRARGKGRTTEGVPKSGRNPNAKNSDR
jgi:hypothetical protein